MTDPSDSELPDAHIAGQHAVITGATGGLGSHIADALAGAGAHLTLAVRNTTKGHELADRLWQHHPDAQLAVLELDLTSSESVERAATELTGKSQRIDVLINNAGIMVPPKRFTSDGFELQMASNHLGHFAWTARLWPLLRESSARVVTVSSLAHATVRGIDLDVLTPLGSRRRYGRWSAYGQSKLANLLFAAELDRRVRVAGAPVVSVAAHPGIAVTNLTSTGPALGGFQFPWKVVDWGARLIGQTACMGARPILMAATDPDVAGGTYFGPAGVGQLRGHPRRVGMSKAARDAHAGAELWHVSEKAAGVRFNM